MRRAGRSIPSGDLRLEAAADLEDIRRAGALYDEIRQALARWPRGGGAALERKDGVKVEGSVLYGDRDRFEIQPGPGKETVFVEYEDVKASSLLRAPEGTSGIRARRRYSACLTAVRRPRARCGREGRMRYPASAGNSRTARGP